MRVAHIITRMIVGGAQENTLLNCIDLVEFFGDDVLLLTGPSLGPEGNLLEQGRGATHVQTQIIPSLQRSIHPFRDWQCYRSLKDAIRSFSPDVVHTHSAKGGMLGRFAASALDVPAIIHTVHGAPFHPYQNPVSRGFFRQCETMAANRCHAMISVADAMTDQLVGAGVADREKFTTIYSGMDVEPFLNADLSRQETRQSLGFSSDHVVVGKVARLFHLKGHPHLIRSAKQVIERFPEVRFLLVGDGILREAYQREIDSMGMTDYFRFTGLVAPDRIPSLMGAMDVLVHASLREGLARTLPQALIAGKPVISFDVDGAREVCITNETGILVPPRDELLLSEAMLRLVGDSSLRDRLGREGRLRCIDRFRHQEMTRQIRALYQRVLAANRPANHKSGDQNDPN